MGEPLQTTNQIETLNSRRKPRTLCILAELNNGQYNRTKRKMQSRDHLGTIGDNMKTVYFGNDIIESWRSR